MGHSSAQTYLQRSISRDRLCLGFSIQRILNGRHGLRRPKGLSMALCRLLGDQGRRAPKGLQYVVLLWLLCQPLSKDAYLAWHPVLGLGAEGGVSCTCLVNLIPQLTHCGFSPIGSQARCTGTSCRGTQPAAGSPKFISLITFSVVLNYSR